MTGTENVFRKYLDFLERANKENISEILNYVDKEVRFKDPLHNVQGSHELHRIFERLMTRLAEVRFTTRDLVTADYSAFFRWRLECQVGGRAWCIEGVTFLTINDINLITSHIEYWDKSSQIYERLPIIGRLLLLLQMFLTR